jgi:hypothetical protein
MVLKYIEIFRSKGFQNEPKLFENGLKINHLATLVFVPTRKINAQGQFLKEAWRLQESSRLAFF